MTRWTTRAPRPRAGSYRDPDLSDKWLAEAEWRARHDTGLRFGRDARTIILRLVRELRQLNQETRR